MSWWRFRKARTRESVLGVRVEVRRKSEAGSEAERDAGEQQDGNEVGGQERRRRSAGWDSEGGGRLGKEVSGRGRRNGEAGSEAGKTVEKTSVIRMGQRAMARLWEKERRSERPWEREGRDGGQRRQGKMSWRDGGSGRGKRKEEVDEKCREWRDGRREGKKEGDAGS
ncbi:hypothetical protein B0H19DRAFT_1078680 [Mycena capillaripes]|nr:hypothetical protein B0H19DRAFT_1078680 [Mycena capillaripes]